ncbi:MAG: hypothetical protein ABSE62_00155 [Chthoniobacteraceae bacterium]|jgi:hypothetical protein
MPRKNAITESGQTQKKEGYPAYDLEECVKFSQAVKDLGGSRSEVSKSTLAKHFKVAESTPSFFQKIGSAKIFGIIDGWGSYTLTDAGKRYFYPTSETDKIQAGLSFLSKPQSFGILLRRFDGEKLPSTAMLGNILHQEAGIVDSWKDRLASTFIRSARFLGIIDDSDILRHDASMQTQHQPASDEILGELQDGDITPKSEEVVRHKRSPAPGSPGHTVWTYPVGPGYIRVEVPEDITPEIWKKLNAYVQILKPFDNGS